MFVKILTMLDKQLQTEGPRAALHALQKAAKESADTERNVYRLKPNHQVFLEDENRGWVWTLILSDGADAAFLDGMRAM